MKFPHIRQSSLLNIFKHWSFRQNCLMSVFSSYKTRKENLILQVVMYNFDRKKFCGKSELPQVFWFSIWLLVTNADIIKADLSSWSYLYFNLNCYIGKKSADHFSYGCKNLMKLGIREKIFWIWLVAITLTVRG